MKRYNTFLYEKSSLTSLGVPKEVMQDIQINFEITPEASWSKIKYKKDLLANLKSDNKALYIEISSTFIRLIISDNFTYYVQYFKYVKDNWGYYEIGDREEISFTQIKYSVQVQSMLWKLEDNNFKLKEKSQRLVQKEMKKFEQTTQDFKYYILENFNKILRRIYGKKHLLIMKKIANNLQNLTKNLNADELMKFLADNKKLAQVAKEYELAKEDKDLLRIEKLEKKYNSLPILDEYLINFEELYSEEFNNRLNIQDLIYTFGRMKIETAFMYFLYTGNINKLTK